MPEALKCQQNDRHQLADGAFGITEIAKMARASRAGAHAGRDLVLFRQVLVVDPVYAEGALLHDPGVAVEFAEALP